MDSDMSYSRLVRAELFSGGPDSSATQGSTMDLLFLFLFIMVRQLHDQRWSQA
jgi:hypothetical protein